MRNALSGAATRKSNLNFLRNLRNTSYKSILCLCNGPVETTSKLSEETQLENNQTKFTIETDVCSLMQARSP